MRITRISLAILLFTAGCGTTPEPDPNTAEEPNSGQAPPPSVQTAGGSVRVQIINNASKVANTSTTMDLSGVRVHVTQRRINAGGGAIVVGPDRADYVVIDAALEGATTDDLPPAAFAFGQDFSAGAVVRFVIDQPADPNDTTRPPPDNTNANTNENDNAGEEPNEEPPLPPVLTLALLGFDEPRAVAAGEVIPFTVSATGLTSADASLRVFADADGAADNGTEITLFAGPAGKAQSGEWNTAGVAPGAYSLFAEVTDGNRFLRIGPAPGVVRIDALPSLQILEPLDGQPAALGSPLRITYIALDPDDQAEVQLFLDNDQTFSGDEFVLIETTSTSVPQEISTEVDLSAFAEGSYFVGGVLDDGIAPPVVTYAAEICLTARTLGVRRLSTSLPGEVTIVRDADDPARSATLRTLEMGSTLSIRADFTGDTRPDLLLADARADRLIDGDSVLVDAGALLLFAPSEGWPALLRPADARLALLGDRDGGRFGASLSVRLKGAQEQFAEPLVGGPHRGLAHPNDGSAVMLAPSLLRHYTGIVPLETAPEALHPSFIGAPDGRELAGTSVAALGDLNGDCRPDQAIGSPTAQASAGRVAVIFGPIPREPDVALDRVGVDIPGVVLTGAASGDEAGASVAAAGARTFGVPDPISCAPSALLIGAPGAHESAGQAYYVGFNSYDPPGSLSLGSVGGEDLPGVVFAGEQPGDRAGGTVTSLDFDGDGARDLAIAAPGYNGGRGRVYVVFGAGLAELSGPTPVSLARVGVDLAGFVVDGPTDAAALGFALASAGDVDSDGREELLIGAPGHDAIGPDTGAAYLLYGSPGIAPAIPADRIGLRCDALGWQFVGEKAHLRLGAALAGGGDLDGNGAADVAIGAPGSRELEILGEAYVLFSASLGGDKTGSTVPPDDGVP